MRNALIATIIALAALMPAVSAGPAMTPAEFAKIDAIASDVLKTSGVPSASVALVEDGRIAYVRAYGHARLEPVLPATPAMRYSIGSISKQFTAAAILMLQESGRLSLDDPVGRFVPGLTRGDEVTIRQILSHTSGYQDFWPQDYVPPMMLEAITADAILDRWARRPLDFDPGTKWQYSNTNYVVAGLVVEKAAGMPLARLLEERVFKPLVMTSVTNTDEHELPPSDPKGYFSYALARPRPAPKEGAGWMFAAGELAMTPEDLAKWDVSVIQQTVMRPESYRELEREILLKSGVGTRYGLGVSISMTNGHRQLEHGGEVSGFTAENIVLPDDGVAVVVLTNQDAASAASQIGRRVRDFVLEHRTGTDAKEVERARKTFEALRSGTIDRSVFTDNANAYFTDTAVKDYAASLQPLGKIQSFTQTGVRDRGGMTYRGFEVRMAQKSVSISAYQMPDGRFEQFIVTPRE